jgi:hypothetical protein
MRKKMMTRRGQAAFHFIAKNPPAMLIAGGILIYIVGNHGFGGLLIVLGFILQVLWLFRGRLF